MRIFTKLLATVILALSVAFVGCKKEQNNEGNTTTNPEVPVVVTSEVTGITNMSAVCGGVVTSDGGYSIIERGVCYGTEHNPLVSGSHLVSEGDMGSFTVNLTGLEPNTTYYLKAYAINSAGIAYGSEVSFTTQPGFLMIKVIEEEGFVHDGSIVDNSLPIKFGFEMSSSVGLKKMEVTFSVLSQFMGEYGGKIAEEMLNGETSYTYIYDGPFLFVVPIFTGQNSQITFTATVWDEESRSSTASFTIQSTKLTPTVSLIEEEGYLTDGQVVYLEVEYEFGFYMESSEGLSSLSVIIDDEVIDEMRFNGETSYTYEKSVMFAPAYTNIEDCTFTAVVTDVNGLSNSVSFTVYLAQNQMLIQSPFEWSRYGGNPGTGLEEFGLYWNYNGKDDFYARIRPLDGVSLFSFDPTVWNEVNTEAEKAALFSSALGTMSPEYEYAHVSIMASADYDDVIGTVLPDGTMRLIHVTHSLVTISSIGTIVTISGEWK